MNVGCVFSLMVFNSPELPYGFSNSAFKRVVCGGDYRRLDSTADIRLIQGPPTAQKGREKMTQNEAVLWLAAMLIALVLSASGCGSSYFSASTESCYSVPNGASLCYKSTKNQENFHATMGLNPDGTLKTLDVQTTATTAESAIAAASAALAKMVDMMNTLIPLLAQAAKAGS